jgi:hypothetical protein
VSARVLAAAAACAFGVVACEPAADDHAASEEAELEGRAVPDAGWVFAAEVVSFDAGEGAGFGQEKLPAVVLGPPQGGGLSSGGLDVLSLGVGGAIVLAFGDAELVDGPGPDFAVFENAFWAGGDPASPFAELGEVAVSADGEQWFTFGCSMEPAADATWPGCAGYSPVEPLAPGADPNRAWYGGDVFDLAELGVQRARFVRILDLSEAGAAPTAGFDLDAVGLLHWR